MTPQRIRICVAALIVAFATLVHARAAVAQTSSRWLFVSDIHLEATPGRRRPASYGHDTNRALFATALREMRDVVPDPPVVVVSGDLLAHDMDRPHAIETAVFIAHAFDRTFPRAQFILTLGNEDSNCGDYAIAPNSEFLRAVARAWEPLVNRRGAAPQFMRTFSHDGFYVSALPVNEARAVVIDDVFWSPRYRSGCGPAGDVADAAFAELQRALAPSKTKQWVFMHIPPGIDVFSTTHVTHRIVVVPFLNPRPRAQLTTLLADPARNVAIAVAGHTHKFAYRIIGASERKPVPLLLVPALSPIFRNAPSFLTADVARDGAITRVEEYSYLDRRWQDDGGLRSLGVPALTGEALRGLQNRLASDRALRARYAQLYVGDAAPEFNESNWRSYWCGATAFSSADFRRCTEQGGFSVFTARGLFALAAGAGAFAVVSGAGLWYRRRKRAA
jgi:sphingomyelin phosphodiesterase acid-like 3